MLDVLLDVLLDSSVQNTPTKTQVEPIVSGRGRGYAHVEKALRLGPTGTEGVDRAAFGASDHTVRR